MGLNVTERWVKGGLRVKKRSLPTMHPGDVWFPPVGHALHHPRGEDPLDEAMVLDIMEKGVQDPILVRDDGEYDGRRRLVIIDGARRVKHALEAERRLRAMGKCPANGVLVEVKQFTGNDCAALLERLARNQDPLKKPDAPSVLAKTYRQLMHLGMEVQELQAVVPANVKRYVATLLEWDNLLPEVAAKFDAGAPLSKLRKVLDGPREQQLQTLEAEPTAKAKEPKPKGLNRPALKRLVRDLDKADDTEQRAFASGVAFALGLRPAPTGLLPKGFPNIGCEEVCPISGFPEHASDGKAEPSNEDESFWD